MDPGLLEFLVLFFGGALAGAVLVWVGWLWQRRRARAALDRALAGFLRRQEERRQGRLL